MPLLIGTQCPSLEDATDWLNRRPTENELVGCPLLIQFWAISCPICKINLPHLQKLLDSYHTSGLQLVSIHTPRMEADVDVEKVKTAVLELNLTGPCAIDNTHTLADRFQINGAWPTYLLFDSESKLRSRAAGQVGLKMAENSIKRLLDINMSSE